MLKGQSQSGSMRGGADRPKPLGREQLRKFVDMHPAMQQGLPRQLDRSMFGHDLTAGAAGEFGESRAIKDCSSLAGMIAHAELSDKHLSDFGIGVSDDVQSWMDDLKAQSEHFIQSRRDEDAERELQDSLFKSAVCYLVDQLFRHLKHYAFELNKVAQGTGLQISSSIMGEVAEVITINKNREAEETVTYFRARLSNSLYTLMLRGGINKLEFYVMPVDKAMALSVSEDQFRPILSINVRIRSGCAEWMVDDRSALFDQQAARVCGRAQSLPSELDSVDKLAMSVFAYFVDITRRELDQYI